MKYSDNINSEEGQHMLLVAGKAHYWDKLIEKIGLSLACDLINGDATINTNKPTEN